jgi:hypothetical protein
MTCICGKSKEVTNLDEKTEPKVCEGCKNDGDIKDVVFKDGKWIAMPCDFLSTRDPSSFLDSFDFWAAAKADSHRQQSAML